MMQSYLEHLGVGRLQTHPSTWHKYLPMCVVVCVTLVSQRVHARVAAPSHVFCVASQVLRDFQHDFKLVLFPILEDANSGQAHNRDGNCKPFAQVFRTEVLTLAGLAADLDAKQ